MLRNKTAGNGHCIKCPVCGVWLPALKAVSSPVDGVYVHESCREEMAEDPQFYIERAVRYGWVKKTED